MNCCPKNKWKWIVIAIFAGLGGYYLWMQHRAHVFQYLPFAFFLLCPLMHVFGHGAHGGHGDSGAKSEDSKSDHANCHHEDSKKREG